MFVFQSRTVQWLTMRQQLNKVSRRRRFPRVEDWKLEATCLARFMDSPKNSYSTSSRMYQVASEAATL